jgi:hypothetical protein
LNAGPFPVELTSEKREKAVDLCSRFSHLDDKDKPHLRVALNWLNDATLDPLPVQAAIKLGVALESLFFHDIEPRDRGEYRFRLGLRAAWCVGASPTERQEISKQVRKAYDFRSEAVHGGALSDIAEAMETLKQGSAIARRAAERVLEEGPPEWNTLALGGGWGTSTTKEGDMS